ncbi:hypothetical protein N864_11635 [Intrasporangium chromatireducens Q5-1]|uniref:Allene oxide cyclase n=1 Tax=Intrasporangium chromatireducens Q5-1 TaxID=584657 RepID=W9GPF3_9MICO|nr:hypothetical protein N864_11635 [Intrasporangium chromatireducens Q5-1]
MAAVAAVGALGLTAVAAGSARAAAQTDSFRITQDVTGDVFTCAAPLGNLTVTQGSITMSQNMTIDGQGIFHVTGTIVPHNVTLVDASGGTYTVSGASWFGGKAVDENNPLVFTETDHFVLHSSTGGVAGKVQMVSHSSPGSTFTFDLGSCEQPQG